MKIILTGASGFVGEGVLMTCLENKNVEQVLMVNRKHIEITHPKLQELIVRDFFRIENYTKELVDYDACFYCAGTSSNGLTEEQYTKITYDTTLTFANALPAHEMVFCFISGGSTDSTEKGKVMWARVKGRTENALLKMPFKDVYNLRPGGMIPIKGQKNLKPGYALIVKVMSFLLPKRVSKLQEVGLSMINTVQKGYSSHALEVADIKKSARA